ncbi:MAG TPA: MFS transporter, partial [Calditrichia bacterium]|nr:MFS transporter [Calditrichia bacterium]
MIASLKKLFSFDKTVWGWAFYDWANSAFATTVMAGFFPIFFKNFWSS